MTKKLVKVITEKLLEDDKIERYVMCSGTSDYSRAHRRMRKAQNEARKIVSAHGISPEYTINSDPTGAYFYASVPERKRKIYINSVREPIARRIAQGIIAAGLIGDILPERDRKPASVREKYDLRRTLARVNEMKDIKED